MYKVTIVDSDTGEIHMDVDSNVVIISTVVHDKADNVSSILVDGTGQDVLIAYLNILIVLRNMERKYPHIGGLREYGILEPMLRMMETKNVESHNLLAEREFDEIFQRLYNDKED